MEFLLHKGINSADINSLHVTFIHNGSFIDFERIWKRHLKYWQAEIKLIEHYWRHKKPNARCCLLNFSSFVQHKSFQNESEQQTSV
jgi:hypothetical protein